jgi:DNA-directed RNA polymerase specialized sigma24 family protein
MVSSTASTRQPPAGGPKATRRLDDLLCGLRRGERDAFVRYFSLVRAPVYQFALLMLRDGREAADATSDALVGTFRRAVLDGAAGVADGAAADLEVMTYRSVLEACEDGLGRTDAVGMTPAPAESALGRRFAAALEGVEPRRRAALLLHDLTGLDDVRRAAVLGLSEAAAAALLFRAREDFRDALRLREPVGAAAACTQAEDAAAGAVGIGLGADGLSRLQRHAEYCAPCRGVMREWTGAAVGLASALTVPTLPQALSVAPVFGDVDAAPAGGGAVGLPALGVLARAGHLVRSRAAAWIVAVACLAAATGLVLHATGVRPLVVMQSVGPAIRLITAPPADGSEPAEARPAERSVSGPVVGLSAARTAVGPSAPAVESPAPRSSTSPRPDATAGGAPDGQQTSGSVDGSGAADSTGAKEAAKAARRASKAVHQAARVTAGSSSQAAEKTTKAAGKASAKAAEKTTKAAGKASSKAAEKTTKAEGKASAKAARASRKASPGASGRKASKAATGKAHKAKHTSGGSKVKGEAPRASSGKKQGSDGKQHGRDAKKSH